MRPSRQRGASLATFALLAAAVFGCRRVPLAKSPEPPARATDLAVASESAAAHMATDSHRLRLELRLAPGAVAPFDVAAGFPRLRYRLVNGDIMPLHVRAHPIWVGFAIWDPSGRLVPYVPGPAIDYEPALSAMSWATTLPAGGGLAWDVDLGCLRVAAIEYPHAPVHADCVLGYRPSAPGVYRVIARYGAPPMARGEPTRGTAGAASLVSDTLRIKLGPMR